MCGRLDYFLEAFAALPPIAAGREGAALPDDSLSCPLLLLTLLDCIEAGRIVRNFFSPTPELEGLYQNYSQRLGQTGPIRGLATPFYHLADSGFWHLRPRPGYNPENVISAPTLEQLRRLYFGGMFSEDLYPLLLMESSRQKLRRVLVASYLPGPQARLNDGLSG